MQIPKSPVFYREGNTADPSFGIQWLLEHWTLHNADIFWSASSKEKPSFWISRGRCLRHRHACKSKLSKKGLTQISTYVGFMAVTIQWLDPRKSASFQWHAPSLTVWQLHYFMTDFLASSSQRFSDKLRNDQNLIKQLSQREQHLQNLKGTCAFCVHCPSEYPAHDTEHSLCLCIKTWLPLWGLLLPTLTLSGSLFLQCLIPFFVCLQPFNWHQPGMSHSKRKLLQSLMGPYGPLSVSYNGKTCILFKAKRLAIRYRNHTFIDLTERVFNPNSPVDTKGSICTKEKAT